MTGGREMYLDSKTCKQFNDKLLYFDIETSLIEVYTHHIGSKCSIYHHQVKQDKKIICISYMAEGWKKPKTLIWDNGDDRDLLIKFKQIADKYPVLVAQNGDNFDVKVLNGRMWTEQLPAFNDVLTLDTLKFSRQNMKLTSHKLDYKLKVMGDDGKNPMEFADWVQVQQGNQKALNKMVKYCEKDVTGLRKVFWSLLPYTKRLPLSMSVLLHDNREGCKWCGSPKFQRNGIRPSSIGMRQRWRCLDCNGSWTDTRLKSATDKVLND